MLQCTYWISVSSFIPYVQEYAYVCTSKYQAIFSTVWFVLRNVVPEHWNEIILTYQYILRYFEISLIIFINSLQVLIYIKKYGCTNILV